MANRVVEVGDTHRVKDGINAVADLVKITLGPKGKYVSLYNSPSHYPVTTNDGVTIAKRLRFEDSYKDLGAMLIQEASQRTNDTAGDGTTTACVLVQAIIDEAEKAIKEGASPQQLAQALRDNAKKVIESIKQEATQIKNADMLAQIATISCRDAEVGKLVADLVHELGADSYITIEDYPIDALIPEQQEGLRIRGMLPSTYFFTNKALQEAVLPTKGDQVHLLVLDHPITLAQEALKVMEVVAKTGAKEAVIVAPEVGGSAMAAILQNWEAGIFRLLPMKVIAYGKNGEGYMRDICAVTGGEYVTTDDGKKLEDLRLEWFGQAGKVIGTFYELAILDGAGDTQARIKEVTAQLPNLKEFEADSARERVAKLQSRIATIKVGADTDSERETKKLLVEDAINASRAALRAGVVAGGGAALYRAAQKLDERDVAARALKAACTAPLRQIAANSEVNLGVEELVKLLEPETTIDFRTGEQVKALPAGVIDPLEVVSSALTNATSMAGQFVLTGAAVVPVYGDET